MDLGEKFDESVIGKIIEEKIKPKPRWQFLLRNYVVWLAGIVSLLVGALSISVIIYLLQYNSWSLSDRAGSSLLELIMLTLPYFWLIFLAIFIFILYYNIKHTKRGYKYSVPIIAVVSISLSIILGTVFFFAGLGKLTDDIFGARAPFYSYVFNNQLRFWSQPEHGRLTGIVISKENGTKFLLLDVDKNEWVVINQNIDSSDQPSVNIGRPVRIIGEQLQDKVFMAKKIMMVGPGKQFFIRFTGGCDMEAHNCFMNNRPPRPDELMNVLRKYPDMKEVFQKDVIERQNFMSEGMKNDQYFIKFIEEAGSNN